MDFEVAQNHMRTFIKASFKGKNELCFGESSVIARLPKNYECSQAPSRAHMCRAKAGIVLLTDEYFLLDNLY